MSGPLIFAAPAPHQGAQRCDGGEKSRLFSKKSPSGDRPAPKGHVFATSKPAPTCSLFARSFPPGSLPLSRHVLLQELRSSVSRGKFPFFFFFFFFMIGFLSKASRPSGREAHKHERDWCCWCCGERRGSVRGPADPQSTRNSTQVAEMLGVPTTGSGCRVSGRTTGSSRPKDWRSAAPRSRGLGGGGRARST